MMEASGTQGAPGVLYTSPEEGHTTGKLTITMADGTKKELSVKSGDAKLGPLETLFTKWQRVKLDKDTVVWAKQSDLAKFLGVKWSSVNTFFKTIGPAELGSLAYYASFDVQSLATVDPKMRGQLALAAAEIRQAKIQEKNFPFLATLQESFKLCLNGVLQNPGKLTAEEVETLCNEARLASNPDDVECGALITDVLLVAGETRFANELEKQVLSRRERTPLTQKEQQDIKSIAAFVVRTLSAHPGIETEKWKQGISGPPQSSLYQVRFSRSTGDVALLSTSDTLLGKGKFKEVFRSLFLQGTKLLHAAAAVPLDKKKDKEIEQEQRILLDPQFDGPGIVQGHDVMEFIDGQWQPDTTRVLMERMDHNLHDTPLNDLTANECKDIMHQLASGLYRLHRRKNERKEEDPAFHFDIKPANILYTVTTRDDGTRCIRAAISDFGSTVFHSDQQDEKDPRFLAAEQHTYGSPAFTPPEFCNDSIDPNYDYRQADVWALGHVFFSIVTGGKAIHETLNLVINKEGKKLSSMNVDEKKRVLEVACSTALKEVESSIPSEKQALFNLCKGMLEFDPAKRLSIDDVVNQLGWLLPKAERA